MTDEQIIAGLKRGDGEITRHYFYDYCRMAYHIYDKKYDLRNKIDMDFYSLAHEYYMQLLMSDWRQLDARQPQVKLSTWLTNGFRYVLLNKLKTYHHHVNIELADIQDPQDTFYSESVSQTVEEIIHKYYKSDRRAQDILRLVLVQGYKSKEVAEQLHISPSAVSQRLRFMMDRVVTPYFKRNYQPDIFVPDYNEASAPFAEESASFIDYDNDVLMTIPTMAKASLPDEFSSTSIIQRFAKMFFHNNKSDKKATSSNEKTQSTANPRITPNFITQLAPNEIFVFGSNLAGMHGGGAAHLAFSRFGARMGQGVGLQGQSYAIPTMQGGVDTIRPYVDEFITFAKEHPDLHFLVTRIGCGIAGFDAEDIAPLFRKAVDVENISLPADFWQLIR